MAAVHDAQKRGVLISKNSTSAAPTTTGQWRRRIVKRATKFMGKSMATLSKKSKNTTTCIAELLSDDLTQGWFVNFTAAAQRLNRHGSVVLTGGDWNYRGVLMNWMAMMDRLNITEYLVFCYDDRLLKIVGPWESGGHGILTPNCSSIQEFMYLKLVGVNALIHSGYSATWSDCDCVWLRPFLDQWMLRHSSEYDVIGQRAMHPRDISNKTGAVLCTGLFTVFPTERSIMLFERVVQSLPDYSDVISDQLVLNEVLDSVGAYAVSEKFVYQDDSFDLTPPQPLDATSPRLGLLPFHAFPRPATSKQYLAIAKSRKWGQSLSVCHIRTSKIASEKLLEMYNAYVLAISMNWAAVESQAMLLEAIAYTGVRIPPLPQSISPRLIAQPLPNLTIASDVSARIDSELRKNLEKILRAKNKTAGYQAKPLRNV
jgi:hypothetical protein